jgi:hypothetical protein
MAEEPPAKAEILAFTVKTLCSIVFKEHPMPSTATVGDFKLVIAEKTGLPPEKFYLFSSCGKLRKDMLLGEIDGSLLGLVYHTKSIDDNY